jgi:demethylmenaquinone methyltransferase/2-methoxy-6-polyprenyl-1,4-benzoquinol methylase
MTRSVNSSQLRDLNMQQDLSAPASKRRYVRILFDTVESSYDWFTRLFSAGMDAAWKKQMATLLIENGLTAGRVLDLATGTGDLVTRLEAQIPGAEVIGADLSLGMVRRANMRALPRRRSNAVADMTTLPYSSGSITAITAGYAFRNAPNHPAALAEAYRVLAPEGLLVTLDFYLPKSRVWRRLFLGYLRVAGRLVGRMVHGVPEAYGYIAASLERWMTTDDFSASLNRSGFQVVDERLRLGGGIAIHLARKRAQQLRASL